MGDTERVVYLCVPAFNLTREALERDNIATEVASRIGVDPSDIQISRSVPSDGVHGNDFFFSVDDPTLSLTYIQLIYRNTELLRASLNSLMNELRSVQGRTDQAAREIGEMRVSTQALQAECQDVRARGTALAAAARRDLVLLQQLERQRADLCDAVQRMRAGVSEIAADLLHSCTTKQRGAIDSNEAARRIRFALGAAKRGRASGRPAFFLDAPMRPIARARSDDAAAQTLSRTRSDASLTPLLEAELRAATAPFLAAAPK